VIGLVESGWENAVAPLGTALTEDQLLAVWQLAPEPILLFDADAAGERAALRAAERALPLLKPGFGLRFASLMTVAGDDPDAVARRYPRQMLHRTLMEAAPISDFLVIVEAKQRRLDSPEHIAALEERLMHHASQIADGSARRRFQQAFRDRLRRTARSADRRQPCTPRSAFSLRPSYAGASPPKDPRHLAERTLVAILLNHPEFFHEVEDEFGGLEFSDRDLDQLRRDMVDVLSGAVTRDRRGLAAALVERHRNDAARTVLDDPLIRSHRLVAPGAALADVRATWDQNLAMARQPRASAASATQARPSRPGNLARQLAHRRAALDEGAE
jgi:DNA primase